MLSSENRSLTNSGRKINEIPDFALSQEEKSAKEIVSLQEKQDFCSLTSAPARISKGQGAF